MALEKITSADLEGKGVIGQPDVPNLSAREMQEKVEQIVREVAIEKINEIITYLLEEGATKEELGKLVLDTGAVTSVFGRAGDITAKVGDYTAEMVGAAPKNHKAQHISGDDAITLEDLGGAAQSHSHGGITADGKLGSFNGMIVTTGEGGILEAKGKASLGFQFAPEEVQINGAFTAQDNKIYIGNSISDFVFTCDSAKLASCHGWVTFGTPGTITLTGFDFVDDSDEITSAVSGSRWEFDLERGCLIIKKR